MKRVICFVLALSLLGLTACSGQGAEETTAAQTTAATEETIQQTQPTDPVLEGEIVEIVLNGDSVTVDGAEAGSEEAAVYVANDIVYYEDIDSYESGNPYGEGSAEERHSAQEADAHLVVHITQPGNYRLSGELTLGQIAVDLGDDAYEDPDAVVNLILDGATIRSTVAPAIVFYNVYECDGYWSVETAQAEVDTTAAGANLILASGSENLVEGSHVARIYKDAEGEKKLWKMDGAIYSYMSMNVAGGGTLNLYADNEGLDSELHLTINSGNINIRADNDGINTNEDGVSVTTINGGSLHIIAGLGEEGDGIDSNGYLVINGGTVVASANPASDAGLDSDMGSYINGGTVVALGSTMDWAESDSDQVTMNLQFSQMQSSGSAIVVTQEDGTVIFAYDPSEDEVLGENVRQYMGAVISCPEFAVGETYYLYIDGTVTGTDVGGVYDISTVTAYSGGVQQAYTSTDVQMGKGNMGGFGNMDGNMGGDRENFDDFTMPEGETMPEGFTDRENMHGNDRGDFTMPEGDSTIPQGEGMGEDFTMPEDWDGTGGRDNMFGGGAEASGEASTDFYMQDKVNFFAGLTAAE